MNIRIYLYQKNNTNEYPNIFVSKKSYERISQYNHIKKNIWIWYKQIFVSENIWIYSNIRIFVTPWPGTMVCVFCLHFLAVYLGGGFSCISWRWVGARETKLPAITSARPANKNAEESGFGKILYQQRLNITSICSPNWGKISLYKLEN